MYMILYENVFMKKSYREKQRQRRRDVPFEIQLHFLDLAEFGLDENMERVSSLLTDYPKLAIIDDLSVDKELTDILISDEDEGDRLLIKYKYRLSERKGSYNALMYFIRNKNITQKQKLINALIREGSNVLMEYTTVEGYRVSHNAILLAKEAKLNRFAMKPLWEKLKSENKTIFDMLLSEFVNSGELVYLRNRPRPIPKKSKPIQIPKKSKPIQIPKKQLKF